MSKVIKMAVKTDWDLYPLSVVLCLFFIHSVSGHYCDNDRCTEEEYCCGDNMCCPSYKVWDLWYFCFVKPIQVTTFTRCGVLFFMFLLSLCACLWRYRFLSNGAIVISGYSYTPLQDVQTVGSHPDVTSGRFSHSHSQLYTPPLGTPPPYNQVSAGNIKLAAPPPPYTQVVGMREPH